MRKKSTSPTDHSATAPRPPAGAKPPRPRPGRPGTDPVLPESAKAILKALHEKVFYELSGTAEQEFYERNRPHAGRESVPVLRRTLRESAEAKAWLAADYASVLGRLLRADDAWAALADEQDHRNVGLDVFVESGSTLLYVSHEIYQSLCTAEGRRSIVGSDPQKLARLSVRTNNNLTAWLYLQNTDRRGGQDGDGVARGPDRQPITPFLVSGNLEGKYHGVFPFFPNAPEQQKDPAARTRQIEDEQAGYSQCRIDLLRCNLLLLATSRLSLLHGPSVGSRQNAIFKNATYNACVPSSLDDPVRHVLHLFITARKLLGNHRDNQSLVASSKYWNSDDDTKFFSISDEFKKIRSKICNPAFDVHTESDDKIGKQVVRSPFCEELCEKNRAQPLPDRTTSIDIGDGRFRVCSTWLELFAKAGLALDVFVSFRADYSERCKKKELKSRENLWIPRPSATGAGTCEQETVCHCQECWIRREVAYANSRNTGVEFGFTVLRKGAGARRVEGPQEQYRLGRIHIAAVRKGRSDE